MSGRNDCEKVVKKPDGSSLKMMTGANVELHTEEVCGGELDIK